MLNNPQAFAPQHNESDARRKGASEHSWDDASKPSQNVPLRVMNLDGTSLTRRERFDPEAMALILAEMRDDHCVHSWHNFTQEPSISRAAERLFEWEMQKRPTVFFFYSIVDPDGRRNIVAAATISERVTNEFPFDGFPVIARCYVRRQFRGKGIYAALMRDRYQYCVQRWGAQLKAIHLGSSSPAVVHVATNPDVINPTFRKVCMERLQVRDQIFHVHDLLSFQPSYAERLRAAVIPTGDCVAGHRGKEVLTQMRESLEHLLNGTGQTDIFHLRELQNQAREVGHRSVVENADLQGLLAFCNAFSPPQP